MDYFLISYISKIEREFEDVKSSIVTKKLIFQSTKWTDEISMINAACEIWALESKLSDATEQHKIILENYRAGE